MVKYGQSDKTYQTAAAVVTIIVVFIMFLLLFGSNFFDRRLQYPMMTLQGGWTVEMPDGSLLNVNEPAEADIPKVRAGDRYVLNTTLPKEAVPGAAIMFYIPQTMERVLVDGKECYSYGQERYAAGGMLKRTQSIVTLPPGHAGKELEIEVTAAEQGAFSNFSGITYGNTHDMYLRFMEERRLPVMVGVFLCIYAFFQMLWLPYLFSSGRMQYNVLFSSVIIMVLGLYTLSYYNALALFGVPGEVVTLVEYGTIYMIPLGFSAYLTQMIRGRGHVVALFCTVLNVVIYVLMMLLHIGGIVHLTMFLVPFYAVALVESVLYLVWIRKGMQQSDTVQQDRLAVLSDKTILSGFTIFIFGAFADVLIYIYKNSFKGQSDSFGISFMMVGSIIFAMCLTAEYFFHGVLHLRMDVTHKELEERAYSDPLTGLANRIRCEQVMRELSMSERFIIISIDVDGLKKINDEHGHVEGDRMLIGFALMLKQCFADVALVGRMGGDEFLVILKGSQCSIVDAKLKELERELFRKNLDERVFRYSVSYGYAGHNETHYGNNVRDIYLLADRRMYDMKRRKKQEQEAAGNA